MKAKTIGYWVTTGVTALLVGSGGVMQIMRTHNSVEGVTKLGYPSTSWSCSACGRRSAPR
ncbi:MAG TPA: hypothetical protein VGM56_30990 [Byssovorax sp.]